MKRGVWLMVTSVLIVSCATTPAGPGPLQTVPEVDIERYMGRWFEIARFQHPFERRLVGVTAEYELKPNGRVRVVNSGFRDTLDGPYRKARGTAYVPDPSQPGALKVTFFWPFAGDYKIFALDEGYQWALVGDDSREYLWFLARDHEIPDRLFEDMKAIARNNGFDLSGLVRVPQKPRD